MRYVRYSILVIVILIGLDSCFYSKEKKLEQEIDKLKKEYEIVINELDSIDRILKLSKQNDSILIKNLSQDSSINN